MAISSEYIQSFIPIYELEPMGVNTKVDIHGEKFISDLSANDLFIVSQLCAESTSLSDAVMISKKLRYHDLNIRLSVDHDIQGMKDDIHELSLDLSGLSSEVSSRYDQLTTLISATSAELSIDYVGKIGYLSNQVDIKLSKKIDKYGEKWYNIPSGYIIEQFEMSDGYILSNTIATRHVSAFLDISGLKCTSGTILGDIYSQNTIEISNSNTTSVEYTVFSDSYVTINANILESKPDDQLEIYLVSQSENQQLCSKIGVFFNVGGYAGTKYFNEYFSGYPIKCKPVGGIGTENTKIVLKYRNGSKFDYDTNLQKSSITFTEYKLHAILASSDFERYVPKSNFPDVKDLSKGLGFYKIQTDQFGLMIGAENVQKNDLTNLVSCASDNEFGLIKTSKIANSPNYGVRLNETGQAYVKIPKSTDDVYGTVRLGYETDTKTNPQKIGVTKGSGGDIFVEISSATSSNFGTIKTGTQNILSSSEQIHDVKIDESGKAYVTVSCATRETYGTIKLGSQMSAGQVYLNEDGIAMVKIQAAEVDTLVDLINNLSVSVTDNFSQISTAISDLDRRVRILEEKQQM